MKPGDMLEFNRAYCLWRGVYLGSSRVRLFKANRISDGVCEVGMDGYNMRRKILGISIWTKEGQK